MQYLSRTLIQFIASALLMTYLLSGQLFAADMQPISYLNSRDPVPSSGLVHSIVVLQNNVPAGATHAELNVSVEAGFTFVSVNNSNCNYTGTIPSTGIATDRVKCNFLTFPGSTSVDINITLRAPVVQVPTVFTSYATVTSDVEVNTANDSEKVRTTVVKGADLNLTKTSIPSTVKAGGIVTYRFDVGNSGPHLAENAKLTDTLPAGLTFLADNASPSAGNDANWSCSAVGQNVICTGPNVDANNTSTFYFRAKVTGSTLGNITNAATVTSPITLEVNPDDNTNTDDLNVTAGTDVGIVKSILTSPVISDQNVTFELNVTNHGPLPADDVNVTDTLPNLYTNVIATANVNWDCNVSANPVIICKRNSTMAVDVSEIITITAQAPHVTGVVVHTNTASVETNQTSTPDSIPTNNTSSVNYDVSPDQADLSINKSKSPSPVAIGQNATSLINVSNIGPRAATPVQVVDALSPNESYVSDSGTDWNCTLVGSNVVCDYSQTLAVGASAPTLSIITLATTEGNLTNTACTGGSSIGGLASAEPLATDLNTLNDCRSANAVGTGDINATNTTDIRVIKTASDNNITINENNVSYTINVKNIGQDVGRAVEFRDIIEAYSPALYSRPATTITASTSNADVCTVTSGLVVCQLGDMNVSDEVNVTITVARPMLSGNINNTASAYSLLTGDVNRTNNVSSVPITVDPIADIELASKLVTPTSVLAGTEATYTIQVRNNGPSTAVDVNMSDVFTGEAFTFISATIAGGAVCPYNSPTRTVNCALGNIPSNTTRAITIVVRPDQQVPNPSPWEINNTATVSMQTFDSNYTNDSKTATLLVTDGNVDLAIVKNESPDFHEPVTFDPDNNASNLIVYQIVIQNFGPSLATELKFVDRVLSVSPLNSLNPQKLKFVRDTSDSNGTDDGTRVCADLTNPFTPGATAPTIDCNLSELAAGSTYIRYLVFHVENAPNYVSGDVYRDEINITSRETDLLSGNNNEDEKTTVRVRTDPQIVKTVSQPIVKVGENFFYTLKVTNNGPGYSPNTNITDTLPANMVLTGIPTTTEVNATAGTFGTCTAVVGGTSFTCNVDQADGTLHSQWGDPGGISEVNITVPVMVTSYPGNAGDGDSPLTNFAHVSTSGPDTNDSNNDDNVTVLVHEPAHIGNRVWHDKDADGIQDTGESGIDGVTVFLIYDINGSVAQTTVTSGGGFYNFDVNNTGDYRVKIDLTDPDLTGPGYIITTENNTATLDSKDSDINATGSTGTDFINYGENNDTFDAGFFLVAAIGDKVWVDNDGDGRRDNSESGEQNVSVRLYDSNDNPAKDVNGTLLGAMLTDSNGFYHFTNLRPGSYHVEFNKTTLPTGYVFTAQDAVGNSRDSDANRTTGLTVNTRLDSNETDNTWDAGIYIPVSIGDYAWHDANGDGVQDGVENNLTGVSVRLMDSGCTNAILDDQNSSGTFSNPKTTDAFGAYLFDNLPPATYCLEFTSPGAGYVITQQNQTIDSNDSDVGNLGGITGTTTDYLLTSAEDNRSVDAGFYIPLTIGNRVWEDKNYNGIQDSNESNISGMTVELVTNGVPSGTTATTTSTGYLFENLIPGPRYSVQFTPLANYNFTLQDVNGTTDELDSDANGTGSVLAQTPLTFSNENNLSFDAGVYRPVQIGDFVWEDTNADGIQDFGEPGIAGVTVTLVIDGVAQPGITDITNGTGGYYFGPGLDLKPNHNYSVQFSTLPVSPRPYLVTASDQGADDGLDSDIITIGATVPGTPIMLSGDSNITLDAGFYRVASMGNRIWYDNNGNGIQDVGEGNVSGVNVELFNSSDVSQGIATTNINGFYHFDNLRPGSYYVIVDKTTFPIGGYVFTQKNAGGDNATDSDVNLTTGRSDTVTLVSNQDDNTTDAGIYIPVKIGDRTWIDTNGNGIQDGEANLSNVGVQLFRTSDLINPVLTDLNGSVFPTATDGNGAYLFDNLRPDNYIVKFDPTPGIYVLSLQNQGGDDTVNSDADTITGKTKIYTLKSHDINLSVDAGFYVPIHIGDRVWVDKNYDG